MAPAAVASLTDQLITEVAKLSPAQKVRSPRIVRPLSSSNLVLQETTRVKGLKRRVEASLRPGAHIRTNQFEVARQVDGLEEKFQVLNRDELAEALRDLVGELEGHHNPWTPEILSLLLQLSERPAQLSKFEHSYASAKSVEARKLTWLDLDTHGAAYSDEDIWEEIDYRADSSDEEIASISSGPSISNPLPRTPVTTGKDYEIPPDVFVPEDNDPLIKSIEKAQFWKQENNHIAPWAKEHEIGSRIISELQLARETIFMLQGLPTSIFWRLDSHIELDHRYTIAHTSGDAVSSLLASFKEIGDKVDAVRQFTALQQTIPYMQTFRRGLEGILQSFDRLLSQKECYYLSPGSTVSLLSLLEDVRQQSRHLVLVADLVISLSQDGKPMRCLDLLYGFVNMLEALGDANGFELFATVFFSCFETYARSIQLWMQTGQVDPHDSTFFVRRSKDNGDMRSLWLEWYDLHEGVQRENIPRFLEPGIQRIFTTGKSMVFLSHLNALPESSEASENSETMFQNACHPPISPSQPLPFSALVESAFEKLIDANHAVSSHWLRMQLVEQCGLWSSIEALEHVYLGKDSSILGLIDSKIFELMDRGRAWDDKFLLTELIRSSFSTIRSFDQTRLVVRTDGLSSGTEYSSRSVRMLASASIDYILPWPVANIITRDAIKSYQRISIFLMQIRRAKYALVRQHMRESRNPQIGADSNLVHALHHNLLWFIDAIYAHFTHLVISTESQSFRSSFAQAEDVDTMIAVNQSFLSSLEDQVLLSQILSPIHDAIISILDLCIHFADLQAAHAFEATASEDGVSDSHFLPRTPRRKTQDDDSDSDEENDEFDHEQTLTISFRDDPYEIRIQNVKARSEHLITFVADGLKGVARADGLTSWNILAERLEWRKALVKC